MNKLFADDTINRIVSGTTAPKADATPKANTGWGDWQGHYFDTVLKGKGVKGIDATKDMKITQTKQQFLDKYKDAIDPKTGKFIPGKVNLYFDDEDAGKVYDNLIGYHSGDGKTGGYFAPEINLDWIADTRSHGGLGQVSDFVSHIGEVVSKNPVAQSVISIAASAYGIPPNVTMALLSANNIAQGQDPAVVARNLALQYVTGKAGDLVGEYAKDALAGTNLDPTVVKGLTNAATGATKGLITSGGNLQAAIKGGVTGGLNVAKGAVGDYVGDLIKDSVDLSSLDPSKYIPGYNGPIIPGVSRDDLPDLSLGKTGDKIATAIVKGTPGYKKVAGTLNAIKSGGGGGGGGSTSDSGGSSGGSAGGGSSGGLNSTALLALLAGMQSQPQKAPEKPEAQVESTPDALAFLNKHSAPDQSSVAQLLGLA